MEKLLFKVYNTKKLKAFLKFASAFTVIASVIAYAAMLFLSFYNSVFEGVKVFLSAAIPFFIVSLIRSLFDAPRPYELYEFYVDKPKEREGKSFPSRHAYSAFAIATLAYYYFIPAGVALTALALLLCAARVLLGIHFIRDVAAGAIIGALSGGLGILLLAL